MTFHRFFERAPARLFGLFGLIALTTGAAANPFNDFEEGYVAAGVSAGTYEIFDGAGNFVESISDGFGGYTTGGFFNTTTNLLYTTDFGASTVVVYDGMHPHQIVQTIDVTVLGGAACESIVFDAAGNFYVGHAAGDADIKKFSPAGAFLQSFDVSTENVGSDWIDLAADQRTMYYTSEGQRIMRYDVVGDVQLSDFAALPDGEAFALRLLPPFDGTGGLIVANNEFISRLNGAGTVVQTYDAPGEDSWFAMNLDPDGTSFWAGDYTNSNIYRFDIGTGAVLTGPINTGTSTFTLFGLIVVGEIAGGKIPATPICFGDGSGAPCGCGNESAPGSMAGCLNGLGVPARLTASGSTSILQDNLVLTADGVTKHPGLFCQGDNQLNGGAGVTFGDGLRCCGGSMIRLQIVDPPGPTQPTTVSSTVSIPNHAPPGTVQAGDTKCYQLWYRDPTSSPCGSTFNFTNAVLVVWSM